MWLNNLKELKKKTGMSTKQIADRANLPERTVSRIFSGDSDAPRVDTLRHIVAAMDGSLDDLFAESGSVVASANLVALQAEVDRLTTENTKLVAENVMLKDDNATLLAEVDILRVKIEHKDEIIALHNYYNKLKPRA